MLPLEEFVPEFVHRKFILLSQLVSDRRLFIILIELLLRLDVGRYFLLANLCLGRWKDGEYHDRCVVVGTI